MRRPLLRAPHRKRRRPSPPEPRTGRRRKNRRLRSASLLRKPRSNCCAAPSLRRSPPPRRRPSRWRQRRERKLRRENRRSGNIARPIAIAGAEVTEGIDSERLPEPPSGSPPPIRIFPDPPDIDRSASGVRRGPLPLFLRNGRTRSFRRLPSYRIGRLKPLHPRREVRLRGLGRRKTGRNPDRRRSAARRNASRRSAATPVAGQVFPDETAPGSSDFALYAPPGT
jgi:hypothetical protein